MGWALLCRSLPYEPVSWDDVTRHEAATALARAAQFIAAFDAQATAATAAAHPVGAGNGLRATRRPGRAGLLPYPVLTPISPATLN